MKFHIHSILSLSVINCAACLGAIAAPLHSPWDAQVVRITNAPYACPAPAHLPVDFVTNGFYADNDPTHSIIDPVKLKAYNESAGPVKHEGNVIVAAADDFRTTGSVEAASCVFQHLESDARDNALTGKMSSSQAYFVQGWVAGAAAIAYLKAEGNTRATAAQRNLILRWLQEEANLTQSWYDKRMQSSHNDAQNHFYWAAVQIGATGIAASNRSDFDWAMQHAKDGIDAIKADGTLDEEMRRGKRALHYHLYAASPLVMLAELGIPNGIDLYSENNGALKKLVLVSTHGLVDPSLFDKRTGIPQERPDPPTAEAIGWAAPYNRRFPDPVITKLLAEQPDHSYMYLGGLPPPVTVRKAAASGAKTQLDIVPFLKPPVDSVPHLSGRLIGTSLPVRIPAQRTRGTHKGAIPPRYLRFARPLMHSRTGMVIRRAD